MENLCRFITNKKNADMCVGAENSSPRSTPKRVVDPLRCDAPHAKMDQAIGAEEGSVRPGSPQSTLTTIRLR